MHALWVVRRCLQQPVAQRVAPGEQVLAPVPVSEQTPNPEAYKVIVLLGALLNLWICPESGRGLWILAQIREH